VKQEFQAITIRDLIDDILGDG